MINARRPSWFRTCTRHAVSTVGSTVAGGAIAGAGSGLLGIIVSYLLGDVPASVLGFGAASSGLTGVTGALVGRAIAGRKSA